MTTQDSGARTVTAGFSVPVLLRLHLSTRERQPPSAAATQAGTAPAARNSQAPGVTLGAEEGGR